jgi:SAM-dependent methyltransferase
MKLTSERDVFDLLDAYLPSAAFTAALELGLFRGLAGQPLTAEQVSEGWGIPPRRCQHWLNLLAQWGLLEKQEDRFAVSHLTQTVILDKYSENTCKFLAARTHRWYPIGEDLYAYLRHPGSVWELRGLTAPSDYAMLEADRAWADQFTRFWYERKRELALNFAAQIDMTGVRRMMDLGGGSGVMSFALAERYPKLACTVVELETVCDTGRAIAAERGLSGRVMFHAANLQRDELPEDFDLVLEADVGLYSVPLFRRVHAALNPGGRFVLNQPWAQADGTVPERLIVNNFRSSLEDPAALEWTLEEARAMLLEAGFGNLKEWAWDEEQTALEGQKAGRAEREYT